MERVQVLDDTRIDRREGHKLFDTIAIAICGADL